MFYLMILKGFFELFLLLEIEDLDVRDDFLDKIMFS